MPIHFYFDLKNWEKAITDLDKTIDLNPQYDIAYVLRGNSKIEIGDKQGACKDYHIALDLGRKEVQENIDEYCK